MSRQDSPFQSNVSAFTLKKRGFVRKKNQIYDLKTEYATTFGMHDTILKAAAERPEIECYINRLEKLVTGTETS